MLARVCVCVELIVFRKNFQREESEGIKGKKLITVPQCLLSAAQRNQKNLI